MIARGVFSLFALGLFSTGALAQGAGEATTPIVVPADFDWGTITADWVERRYKVEAIRFKARDETGVDWPGSDEVMVGTFDAKGATVTNEIGDIDSGDVHEFDPAVSCIVGVRPGTVILGKSSVCDEAGEPGPFSFKVEMWEKDAFGYPPGFCAALPPPPGHHNGPHCVNDHNGDDFIGWRELFFPIPDLETTLPNVGDSFIETVALNPCEGDDICGAPWAGFPDYSFTYRTTRLPDVHTTFRDELLAAMRRSRIAIAGDAVAAGLRSLPAPVDRQAEAKPEPRRTASLD